nr:unnamed protein product [Digitaria exilis]
MPGVITRFAVTSIHGDVDGAGCDHQWVLLPPVSSDVCPPCSGVSQISSSAQTLAGGFLAVVSVNMVIGFYIFMAMKETPHRPQPDPTFLANAKVGINQPTSSQMSDDSKGKGKIE